MMNKVEKLLAIALVMFVGCFSCFAASFEQIFWLSLGETLLVAAKGLGLLFIGSLIVRFFGGIGLAFVFACYIMIIVICLINQGFPA